LRPDPDPRGGHLARPPDHEDGRRDPLLLLVPRRAAARRPPDADRRRGQERRHADCLERARPASARPSPAAARRRPTRGPHPPPAVASTWQPGSSMLRRSYSPAYGYLLAAVATAIIALARFGGSDMLDSHSRYMPFILAVMVAAWYGGLMPGLFATFLAALV